MNNSPKMNAAFQKPRCAPILVFNRHDAKCPGVWAHDDEIITKSLN